MTKQHIRSIKSPGLGVESRIILRNCCGPQRPERTLSPRAKRFIAGEGGGFILWSNHRVSSSVSGHICDYLVPLVREFGTYPSGLPAELDEAIWDVYIWMEKEIRL